MSPPIKIIRASAGSGKTFSLTAHYLILLFSGPGKYKEILAVTFTNKATAEMKDRILAALRELADPEIREPTFRFVLREQYPDLSDSEIQVRASTIYRAILHDFSRFSISTIDGFVQQVIRSFAFELNLDSGYKLEMNQQKVKDELVKGLNRRLEDDPGLLEWVTGLAIDRINDGKDWNYQKALDSLADEIFKERYFPFQEAMRLMDTNRDKEFSALKQMVSKGILAFKTGIVEKANRVQELLGKSGVLPDELAGKSTHPILKLKKVFDEEFDHVLRLAPLTSDFALWPNRSLKDTGNVARLFDQLATPLTELVDFHSEGILRYETYRAIYKNSPYLRLMQEMADLMSRYRSENRVMLISDAQGLLRGITSADVDNPSFIWEKTGTRYRHFLFDEFQDTSGFQWENFLPLVKNAIAEHEEGAYPGHLIVGDVKQSIYRWRNGDWRILHNKVKTDLEANVLSEHDLEFNRRSSKNIIEFNNFLYQTIPKLLQERINSEFAEKGRGQAGGFWDRYQDAIAASYRGSFQHTTDQTVTGGKIEVDLLPKDSDHEEGNKGLALDRLVKKMILLLGERRLSMGEICILVRTNTEAEDVIRCLLTNQEELSAAAGTPLQVISGDALKISNDHAVQLLTATLQLLAAREDENNIFRTTCARLYYELHHPLEPEINISEAGWMKLAREPLSKLSGLLPAGLCNDHEAYLQLPVAELVEKLIAVYGLGEPVLEGHFPYLFAFRDQVTSFAAGGDQGINAFLDWWNAEGDRKSLPSADIRDAVNVMTIHKSKGLEFEAVLIPFCNWSFNTHSLPVMQKVLWVDAGRSGFNNFSTLPVDYSPSLGATVFAENYFEEMLLNYMDTLNTLYVATTRAKNYLYIVSPQKSRSDYNMYDLFSHLFDLQNPFQQNFILDGGSLSAGEFVSQGAPAADEKEAGLFIREYIVHDPISSGFASRHLPENTWFNEQQRKGSVLHELLARINRPEEIDNQLTLFIEAGSIRESERSEFKSAIGHVLNNERISDWMQRANRVISEKNILIAGGKAERPDKVFVLEDRAILLDFKFGEPKKSYNRQLESYRELLKGIGTFGEVEAYIWYDQLNSLQEV